MNYFSTRGQAPKTDFAGAILAGLAPDGGLYLPEVWPDLRAELPGVSGGNYAGLTATLLKSFGAETMGETAINLASERTRDAFLDMGQAPLRKLSDNLWLLELYHGPTLAFKDMAMQMMAPLLDAALEQRGETLTLLTATSGDTGAAAVHAFAGSKRVKLCVFHPLGRVSPVQRLQMTTVMADNILNIGLEGDFDDCQTLVKALLNDPELKAKGALSSVNSINWGRLLGQVPYYLAAQAASGIKAPDFVVPTGNFGDAFAGWAARKVGGSIGSIHCAVNQNDALSQAIHSGHYLRETASPSASVSMDVQAPSNFERMFFEASGRNSDLTRSFFEGFATSGQAQLDPALQTALKAEVSASSVSEAETAATIKQAYNDFGLVISPHTAVALAAAWIRGTDRPQIVLSTAHPAKFPEFVTQVLGFAPAEPDSITALRDKTERLQALPNDLPKARTQIMALMS